MSHEMPQSGAPTTTGNQLYLITGTYQDVLIAFGYSSLVNTPSSIGVLATDISRLSFFSQEPGDWNRYIEGASKSDPRTYLQGDLFGTCIAHQTSDRLIHTDSRELYTRIYETTEDLHTFALSLGYFRDPPKDPKPTDSNDSLLSGFSYACASSTPNSHWIISIIHQANKSVNNRLVHILVYINPVLMKHVVKEDAPISINKVEISNLPGLLHTMLNSHALLRLLGFSKDSNLETSVLHPNGDANPEFFKREKYNPRIFNGEYFSFNGILLTKTASNSRCPLVPGNSTEKERNSVLSAVIEEERQEIAETAKNGIKKLMENVLFYLDDSEASNLLVGFLKERHFPENKLAGNSINTDRTNLNVLITGNSRFLRYGEIIFAECIFEEQQCRLTTFPLIYKSTAYDERIPEDVILNGYIDELLEICTQSQNESIGLSKIVKSFLIDKGFQEFHLCAIALVVQEKLKDKIIASEIVRAGSVEETSLFEDTSSSGRAEGSSSDEGKDKCDKTAPSPRDSSKEEKDKRSPRVAAAKGSSDAVLVEDIDALKAQPEFQKPNLALSIFSRKPTRIAAGVGGAVATATGGTGLALEFLLPAALAFLHLGPAAILALSIALVVLGLSAISFGVTKVVQAHKTAKAAT